MSLLKKIMFSFPYDLLRVFYFLSIDYNFILYGSHQIKMYTYSNYISMRRYCEIQKSSLRSLKIFWNYELLPAVNSDKIFFSQ